MNEHYRADLARVYGEAFGFHAENCAPGLLTLLEPVRASGGTVLEIGCGTGLLTRRLVDAGHRVIASDASAEMLAHAARLVPDAQEIRQLRLPHDPLPPADVVVGIGNVLNYLGSEDTVLAAFAAIAEALRPGGLVAVDLCDLAWADAYRDTKDKVRLGDDWVMISRFTVPRADRFRFDFTIFTDNGDGTGDGTGGGNWRRDDERHEIALVDTARLVARLPGVGLHASARPAFGGETLPPGLLAIVGKKGNTPP